MAQQTIDIGGSANDGTGDPIRDAFDKCNDNFTELYAGLVGLLDFKGSTDCSTNPNYPAASKGDFYVVSVAGKIGGASGVTVEVGDAFFAKADNAGGTQASVGSSWTVIQANIVGGTISELDDIPDVNAPSPATNDALVWDGAAWVNVPLPGGGSGGTVPDGGTTGQILMKQSGADQDDDWDDLSLNGLSDVDTTGASAGKRLAYDGSGWVARGYKGALVRKAADQTTANYTTATSIAWDSEIRDTDSFHDAVTNNTRLTIPSGVSKVRLSAQVRITNHTADTFASIFFAKNGSITFDGMGWQSSEIGSTAANLNATTAVLDVSPGDYFEIQLQVESDTSITVEAARSWFSLDVVE